MTSSYEWNGRVGDVWADEWRRTDRSFADLGHRLNAAILAVAPGSGTAIDIGCGAGATSIALAKAQPGLSVTGIDLSSALIAIARERAAEIANLSFHIGDVMSLDSQSSIPAKAGIESHKRHAGKPSAPPSAGVRGENNGADGADLLVSRHGVMFFDDPVAGFAALRRGTKCGGKLVFSCFRPRAANEWALVVDAAVGNDGSPPPGYAPGPYGLADRDFTADVLARAGWHATAEAVDFTYVAGAGEEPVADAVGFLSRIGSAARAMADAPPYARAAMRESLRTALTLHVHDGAVTFRAGAWIWTATAGEPACR